MRVLLVASLLLIVGCSTPKCKSSTVRLAIDFGAGVLDADSVSITLSINGVSAGTKVVPHDAGDAMETIEIDFTQGYPKSQQLAFNVIATRGGTPISDANLTLTASSSCSAATIDLATATFDAAVDAAHDEVPDATRLPDLTPPPDLTVLPDLAGDMATNCSLVGCSDAEYCWKQVNGGDNHCYVKPVAGATCSVDSDCNSGICVQGFCCGTTSPPEFCIDNYCQSNMSGQSTCEASSHYTTCSLTITPCTGHLACANAQACNSACHSDSDCVSGYYCNSVFVCEAQIASMQACDPTDCAQAGCKQCISGGTCTNDLCP